MAKETKIQWHPAFCDAMELTFADEHDALIFDREYNLSSLPLRVDLLIIRKKDGVSIKNMIGQIFRRNNLFEYKAPGDDLNIDTFYKTVAYACLYKTQGKRVDEIKDSDITVTMLRNNKPEKLISDLKLRGITAESSYPGIYYLYGDRLLFRTQIIVTKELPPREYNWLQSLTKNISNDEAHQLVTDATQQPRGSWQSRAADEVIQVAMSANSSRFEELKKEDPYMCEALMELMKPEFDAKLESELKKELDKELKKNTEQVTETVTKSVTKSVTSRVRKEDSQKEMNNRIKLIRSLVNQNVPVDVITRTFGEESVNKALGKKKAK